MESTYITIDEAAKLEGNKYMTLYMKIQRNLNEYDTKTISSKNGGKDRVLIAVDSLSKKARRTFKAKKQVHDKGDEFPWYVEIDFNWYKENYKDYFYNAVEMSKYIEEYLSIEDKGKTQIASNLAKKSDMSSRTFLGRVRELTKKI